MSLQCLLVLVTACAALQQGSPRRNLLQLQPLGRPQRVSLLSGWKPWAKNHGMKVVYGVFTSPLPRYAKQLAAVEDTWAKDVPPQKLLVVGVNGSTPGVTYKQAPACQDGHVSNSGISCKEATLLSTGYELGADWVVVLGSDNYVFPKHMEARLLKENAGKAQILGVFGCGDGKYCEDGKSGLCGGAGYAISRGALDKMVGKAEQASEVFIQESMETARTVSGYWSDQATSCIARRRGVKEVQLENLYGWKLCEPGSLECDFSENAYRRKIVNKKHKPLTFHYIGPEEMNTIHQMAHEADADISFLDYNDTVFTQKSKGQVDLSLLGFSSSGAEDTYEAQRTKYIRMMNEEMEATSRPSHQRQVLTALKQQQHQQQQRQPLKVSTSALDDELSMMQHSMNLEI